MTGDSDNAADIDAHVTEGGLRSRPRRRGLLIGVVLALALIAAAAGAYLLTSGSTEFDGSLDSIASDCRRPVDVELNRYLASVPNGSTVRFKRNGCYRQVDSLWMRDRKNIVLDGNGATFAFDTKTGLKEYWRSNWRIQRGSRITLKNMTVRGACKPRQCNDSTIPPEKDGYVQHGIHLESTARPVIDRVHVRDTLGDGISAEGTLDPKCCWSGAATTDLVIRNSHIERAGRQLIAVTNGDGGLIVNNVIENAPQTGIDLEVDVEGFKARNLRIVGNTFDKIHASIISNGGIGAGDDVTNITIERNRMRTQALACGGGIYLRAPGPDPRMYRSGYVIRDNTLKLIGPMLQAERIRDLKVEGNTVEFKPVGCEEKGAIELIDSHAVSVAHNRFGPYATVVHNDADSTQVVGP